MNRNRPQTSPNTLCIGAGPALILVGGLHGHFEFQRPAAQLLGRHFQVFCPSLPGEEAPDLAPDSVEETARRLLEQIPLSPRDQFLLCGISMGGAVSLEMALQAPQRIRRLAVVVSFAEYKFLNPPLGRLFDSLLEKGLERTCRRIARSTFLALTLRELVVEAAPLSTTWQYWNRFRRHHSQGDLVWKRLRMMRKILLLDRVSELKMPVLLVTAQRDHLVHPSHTVEMAGRIPQAQLKTIPGSGHLFPFLRPERLAEALAPFLKEEEPVTRR